MLLTAGIKCEPYVASSPATASTGDSPAPPPPSAYLTPSSQVLLSVPLPVSQQQAMTSSSSSVHRISPDTRERLKQTLLSVRVRKRKLAASLEADSALAADLALPKLPKLPLTAPVLGKSVGGTVWSSSLGSSAGAGDEGDVRRTLEADTINFIHYIYCQECRVEADNQHHQQVGPSLLGVGVGQQQQQQSQCMTGLCSSSSTSGCCLADADASSASLAAGMDLNKHSQNKTVLIRRSVSEIVARPGLPPSLRPLTNFAEQKKNLKFDKTGDIVNKKVAGGRSDRLSVLQQTLNQHLLTRPGPLDLVQNNILPADAGLKQAIAEGRLQFQSSACAALQLYCGLASDELDLSPDCPSDIASPHPQSGDVHSSASPTSGCLQTSDDTVIPATSEMGPLLLQQQTSSCPSLPPTSYAALSPTSSTSSSSSSSTCTTLDSGHRSLTGNGRWGQQRKARKNSATRKASSKQVLGGAQKGQRMFKFHYYNSKIPDKSPPSHQQQHSPAGSPLSSLVSVGLPSDAEAQTVSSTSRANCSSISKQHLNIILQQQFLFLHWQERQKQLALTSTTPCTPAPSSSTTISAGVNSTTLCCAPACAPPAAVMVKPGTIVAGKTATPVNTVAPTIVNKLSTVDTAPTTTTLPPISHLVNKPAILTPIVSTVAFTHPTVVQQPADPPVKSTPGKMTKLEHLTVKQLKAELKARCMTATGTKPQLVERLKCHEETILESLTDIATSTEKPSQAMTVTLQRQANEISLDDENTTPDSTPSATGPLIKRALSSAANNDLSLSVEMSRPSSTISADVDVTAGSTLPTSKAVVAMPLPMVNCPGLATNVILPTAGGGYTMGVNPLVWQQAAAAMMGMQMFAPSATSVGAGGGTSPMLLSAVQQATLVQQQQFLQLVADPRNWLAMQQMVQQQMLVCSQSMQQATARVQQQQAALLALQQQQPSLVASASPQPLSALATPPLTIVNDPSFIDSATTTPTAAIVKSSSWPALNGTTTAMCSAGNKSLSNEEMLMLQQQQQIHQLHTALHQSQQRLAEAEQQAEQQAKYWSMLQQQFLASLASSYHQQQLSSVTAAATPSSSSNVTAPPLPLPMVTVTPATPVSPALPPFVQQQQTLPSISVLQQDLKCGLKMSVASHLSTSPAFVFSPTHQHQQDTAPLTSASGLNQSACTSQSDVRMYMSMATSTPAGHTTAPGALTEPVLSAPVVPEKTPPKYDEAVKNGQFIKRSFDMATNNNKPVTVKNINIDDVFELLIQQGEISHDASSQYHQLSQQHSASSSHQNAPAEAMVQQMTEHFPSDIHIITPAVTGNFFESFDGKNCTPNAPISFNQLAGVSTSQTFDYTSNVGVLPPSTDGGLQLMMPDGNIVGTTFKMAGAPLINDSVSSGADHFAIGGCSLSELPFMEWPDPTDDAASSDLMSGLVSRSTSGAAVSRQGEAVTTAQCSSSSLSSSTSFDDLIVSEFLNLPHEICNGSVQLANTPTKALTPAANLSSSSHFSSTAVSPMLSSSVSPISSRGCNQMQLSVTSSSSFPLVTTVEGDFDWCDAISSGMIGEVTSLSSSSSMVMAKCHHHDDLDLLTANDLQSSLDFDMSLDRVLVTSSTSGGP